MTAESTHSVVEMVSVDRAMELLQMHKDGRFAAEPIVSVIRDPSNMSQILTISIAEREVFLAAGGR